MGENGGHFFVTDTQAALYINHYHPHHPQNHHHIHLGGEGCEGKPKRLLEGEFSAGFRVSLLVVPANNRNDEDDDSGDVYISKEN